MELWGYLSVLSLQIFVIDHELWLEEVICGYCLANFCHWPWTMTERGYLWVLSLQIFVIDYGTMTGRGYLSVLSLQIFVIGEHCPYWQWRHLTVNHGTMTGRGCLWVLSLQIFVIDYWTMTGRGYLRNKFLKYMNKELVLIESLVRWIGPRRRKGPLASAPLALARYSGQFCPIVWEKYPVDLLILLD